MPRISKPPEERRQEILDTAMRLFTERGYEETSMADIAREMDVVQGPVSYTHLAAAMRAALLLKRMRAVLPACPA